MKNPSPLEIFQLIDLTTLNATDSLLDIKALADFAVEHSQRGFSVAAICVHANFAENLVAMLKSTPINAAVVAGAFPHGQANIQVKTLEIECARENGVQEIDIVINRGLLLSRELESLEMELKTMRNAAGTKTLKTIIESGELESEESIRIASKIALASGADFIKTSTGKSVIGATPNAVKIMCEEIREFHKSTGLKKGIKISGGVRTYKEASNYYTIVQEILGEAWLNKKYFRIGASSLAKEIISLL